MQGVACMLRKNLECLKQSGIRIEKIISTGGGARSPIWTQLKADISGYTIEVPADAEAPCLGAAILSAVQEGYFSSCDEAVAACTSVGHRYAPSNDPAFEQTYRLFCHTCSALEETFRLSRENFSHF